MRTKFLNIRSPESVYRQDPLKGFCVLDVGVQGNRALTFHVAAGRLMVTDEQGKSYLTLGHKSPKERAEYDELTEKLREQGFEPSAVEIPYSAGDLAIAINQALVNPKLTKSERNYIVDRVHKAWNEDSYPIFTWDDLKVN